MAFALRTSSGRALGASLRHGRGAAPRMLHSSAPALAVSNFVETVRSSLTPATTLPSSISFVDGGDVCRTSLGEASKDVTPAHAELFHNSPTATLYEHALKYEQGTHIVSSGALAVSSGIKTGRSPTDKRIVDEPSTTEDIWWGKVNMKLDLKSFLTNRERAVDYLNLQDRLYVVDCWAGWETDYRFPVRIVTSRAYHALFMQNMLIPIKPEEQEEFLEKKPFLILNAGCFPANRFTSGMSSATSVSVSFERGEMVILGTQYAGEMKKGVFTVMMYHMPFMPSRDLPLADRGLPMHASANIGKDNDVSIFFGLSGTGKTTLSADPHRYLIGDDEHVWTKDGIFNIENGCYAKTIALTEDKEPEVYRALKFGAVLENVVWDDETRDVDYFDSSKTENTRASYPLSFIPGAMIPATVKHHPKNIILLTCDAFGVLPPISKLTSEQLMYHFISGYTAKVAGTEMGIKEPQATFSACFGGPFLALHPGFYAKMLAAKLETFGATAWLVNSGWVGGGYGVGERSSLKYTRALIDAIHDGTLDALPDSAWETTPVFGLQIPKNDVNGVPKEILSPQASWLAQGQPADAYEKSARSLAKMFVDNFAEFSEGCEQAVLDAAPRP